MRNIFLSLALVGAIFSGCQKSGSSSFSTDGPVTDSVSYALGFNVGQNFRNGMVENGIIGLIDREAFARAFVAALDSQACQLTNAQLQAQMMALQIRQQAARSKAFEGIKAEGESFLAENAKKEGVQTTESGLQYKVVKAGGGPKPTLNDKVKVHYHGTLIDGTVFDSSIDRGEPVEFPVTGVIPGWTEALQLMPVGSKWTLWIPSQLAYGENSPGDEIPPYSTLIFEVELLGIAK